MNDGKLLLRAIIEHPHDDAPRAQFADWLQDQDDAESRWLGEFMAAQLAGRSTAFQSETESGVSALLLDKIVGHAALEFGRYGARLSWLPNSFITSMTYWRGANSSIPLVIASGCPRFDVNRGFVCGIEAFCDDFLKCAGPLFARHPVEHVTLFDKAPSDNGTNLVPSDHRGFMWCRCLHDGEREDGWGLRSYLFDGLTEFRDELPLRHQYLRPSRFYDTREAAAAALERSALAHGRGAAAAWLAAGNNP